MGGNCLSGKESRWYFSRWHEPRARGEQMQDGFGEQGVSQLEWSAGCVSRKMRKPRQMGKEHRDQAKEFKVYTWTK